MAQTDFSVDLGLSAKIYYKSGDTYKIIPDVTGVTVNMQRSTADVTTRRAKGWKQSVGTLRECTVDFDIISNSYSAGSIKVFTDNFVDNEGGTLFLAFMNKEAAKNGVSTGAMGPVGFWSVTQFNNDQTLEEAIKYSIQLTMSNYVGFGPSFAEDDYNEEDDTVGTGYLALVVSNMDDTAPGSGSGSGSGS